MATQFVWESVSRSRRPLGQEKYVSIRKNSLKISAGFATQERLHEQGAKYVAIKRDMVNQCLLLQFLTQEELDALRVQSPFIDGIFAFSPDGGGRRRKQTGGVIQCGAVVQKTPWLKCLADAPAEQRTRFAPEPGPQLRQYIIRMIPGFMFTNHGRSCDAPSGVKGIYCYEDQRGKVLYIGQGIIQSRFRMHAKEKNMSSVVFRWTAIEDEELRLHAEAHHLDRHVERFGCLPAFNTAPPAEKHRRRSKSAKDVVG